MSQVVSTIAELRALLAPRRAKGIAMVPTMGALHDGHLSLVRAAALPTVVVSIFVNPTQFAPHEDFDAYPRDLDSDLKKLATTGSPIVFAPAAREMYPEGFATTVTVGGPSAGLETDFRPHFFAGVATVVAKLLLAALPDRALFGEKDYQQLLVVRRLAKDLGLPTEIIGAPIAREADGLAMSSRNAYLDARERSIAGNLNKVLKDVIVRAKETGNLRDAEAYGAAALAATGFDTVDYVAIRDAETLAPAEYLDRPARVLAAAKIGRTRLIDNMGV
ncbi:MAG TPA: pantoate--beta-alanine ligase [Rhizomicrobium sp.]|nr:pantoate--beta-alanine ligase [Rhizomicrobium sp.]